MRRRTYEHLICYSHETMFYISIFQLDITLVSIAAVFFKKIVIIIAILGQIALHWQLNKVMPSGMHNCNFEEIN